MQVDTIVRTIVTGNFSNDELNKIVEAVRFARSQITKSTIRTLTLGTQVKFTNSRNGQTLQGKVCKVGRKFVKVDVGNGLWRVPANMLEAV